MAVGVLSVSGPSALTKRINLVEVYYSDVIRIRQSKQVKMCIGIVIRMGISRVSELTTVLVMEQRKLYSVDPCE